MKLATIVYGSSDPTMAVALGRKVLRVQAAAEVLGVRPAQRAHFASVKRYLAGLPGSERVLRRMLQLIAEEPSQVAGKDADGEPLLLAERNVTFLAPVLDPGKILCVGLNYRDHCEEQNKPIPEYPLIFSKYATSLTGHESEVPLPLRVDPHIDYEAEVAFVVGKTARRVKRRNAMAHIAGYMPFNDITARTLQAKERQWSRAKGFDSSAPCGPWLVTSDEVPDPGKLGLRCKLNGRVMQSSSTKNLIFPIDVLVEYITAMVTLEPGDIVSTGTPAGVGVYREPQVFLKPGDEVEVTVDRLGSLLVTCV